MKESGKSQYIKGLVLGIMAFTIWGLLPLYWRLVSALDAYQIFGHRIIWSFVFLVVVLWRKRQLGEFLQQVKTRRTWIRMAAPALFISVNWLTYIWSVNNGYVIEASLGYFINPLVLTFFGMVFFKESLSRLQWVGILFAATGVLYKTLTYGQVPYIALILAVTFAVYGLLKKLSPLTSLQGLGFETMMVTVPALIFLSSREFVGSGILGNLSLGFLPLIMLSGIATATPLLLYAESTKRLPLNVVGFLQYIAPTLQLVLGIFVYREAFDVQSFFAFALIWTGLIFFSVAQYRALRLGSVKHKMEPATSNPELIP